MRIPSSTLDTVAEAAGLRAELVEFAQSPPMARYLRDVRKAVAAEAAADSTAIDDSAVLERFLTDFTFDDGSTVADRFAERARLDARQRAVLAAMADEVAGIFEVVDASDAEAITLRCTYSDLEHVVVPTTDLPELAPGDFLIGRLYPVADTSVWVPTDQLEHRPAAMRAEVAAEVRNTVLHRPELTFRNPEYREKVSARMQGMYDAFVAEHGTDRLVVPGDEVARVYQSTMLAISASEGESAGQVIAEAQQLFDDADLASAESVLIVMHPISGLSLYRDYRAVERALHEGRDADEKDIEVFRSYILDENVAPWFVRELIEEALPTSQEAIARAIEQDTFDWAADGDEFVSLMPGRQQPVMSMAHLPAICTDLYSGASEQAN